MPARQTQSAVVRPTYFSSAAEFRAWLEANHASKDELLLGFYKTSSGKTGITYSEALDEALCFGWIDGIRKTVDDARYTIRITPRRARSIWSEVNTRRVQALTRAGRMAPAGLKAFAGRDPKRAGLCSFEQRKNCAFTPEQEKQFRATQAAWDFFRAQAPSYQRTATWWVVSAVQDATRQRRLAKLIACSARGRRFF